MRTPCSTSTRAVDWTTSPGVQPHVDIWGHFELAAILGLSTRRARANSNTSAYISTAIDRLTGPRNDFSKLNDPFSTGSILPCQLEFSLTGAVCALIPLWCQPPCGALSSCVQERPRKHTKRLR
jgi:hypothetical protein